MSTLADLMKPETRNILEKYKRLSSLASEMGIESDKSIDLSFLKEKLKNIKHKNKDEALNLIEKLLKIKK
tara:strand:+ start:1918 stop:2127 length:210 start_codon:yes stop_codon:yes gene_type:complete